MRALTAHRRVVLAQAAGQGAVLLATPFLSRQVPVAELGSYQTALAIALALQPIATLRIDFILPGVTDGPTASMLLRRGHASGLGILASAAILSGILAFAGHAQAAAISACAGALTVAYSWLALDGGRFIRTQELSALAVRNLVSGLAAAVLQCAIALFAPTAIALSAAIVAARVLAVLLSRSKLRSTTRVAGPANRSLYPLRRLIPAVATSLLDTTILQSLVVIPGALLGPEAAGYTGMSQRVTTSPASLVVGGLGQVAQAHVAAAIHAGEHRVLAALKPTIVRLGAVAVVLGLAVGFIAPHLVVPVLGPRWEQLQWLLPITAPALAMQIVSLPLVPVGMMLRAEVALLKLNVSRLIVIAGGTALTALCTHALSDTVIWWSVSSTVGYGAQLWLVINAAQRWQRTRTTALRGEAGVPARDFVGSPPGGQNPGMPVAPEKAPAPEVLLLAKRFPPVAGGVAQYSVQVARAYARRGLLVSAVTQATNSPGWRVDQEQPNLRILNVGPGSQPVAFAKFLLATRRLLRDHHFGLVHATTWRMALIARILARSTPLVVTVHGREVLNFPRPLGIALRNVLRKADLVFAVSKATMGIARRALGAVTPEGTWHVRYNGLSYPHLAALAEPRSEGESSVEVLSLCRLVPRKNVAGSLRAVAAVRRMTDQALHMIVAGTGPERASLEALASELEIRDIVEFAGFVDDDAVPGLYGQSDIFLHPHTHVGEGNDYEGFGITIADAMSFGCAAIVGDAGGPAELITDGVEGRLVAGLDAEAVAEALHTLVRDATYRRKLGEAARRSALRRFSWDDHITPALELLKEGARQ